MEEARRKMQREDEKGEMMKSLRKAAVTVLAMVVAFALAAPAIASESYTVTINGASSGHTYEAYQIFAGDLSEDQDGTKILSNVEWGAGVSSEGKVVLGDAGTKADSLKTTEQAEAFAQLVGSYLASPVGAFGVSDGVYSISGLTPGYYLIKDKDSSLSGDNAYTAFILKVVGNVNVSPKSAQPTVDKQVRNSADSADGWCKVADYAINQSFQFKLTASLPADTNLSAYDTYKVVLTDEMADGITFESIESVKVGDSTVPADGYVCTATAGQAGGSWALTVSNIKAYDANLADGAVVTVIYNAHLNGAAQVAELSNANSVNLQYSNNPNVGGEGSLGKTPDAFAWVFTYGINNTKVDGDAGNAPLAGAGFKLYSDANCVNEVALAYSESRSVYCPVGAGTEGVEMVSAAENGQFNVIGLDAGTYYLKETTTPAGYNTCDVVKVVVTASPVIDEDGIPVSNVNIYVNNNTNTPVTEITVVNERGAALPSTGGMGTAAFYIAGAVLLIGAMAALVWRCREGVK